MNRLGALHALAAHGPSLALSLGAHVAAMGLVGRLAGGEPRPAAARPEEPIVVEVLALAAEPGPAQRGDPRTELGPALRSPGPEPEPREPAQRPRAAAPRVPVAKPPAARAAREKAPPKAPPPAAPERRAVEHPPRAPGEAFVRAPRSRVRQGQPAEAPKPVSSAAVEGALSRPPRRAAATVRRSRSSSDPGLRSSEPLAASALVALAKPRPRYPPRALRSGIQGTVTLEFVVTADGAVRNPLVVASEPPGIFDEAAKRGVLRWRFEPKRIGGIPTEVRARLDVSFRLDGG